jgi:hypothetical protein
VVLTSFAALRLAAGWVLVTIAVGLGVSVGLGALIGVPVLRTVITALPSTILLACLAGIVGCLRSSINLVRNNMFGLCSGLQQDWADSPALTNWLNHVLNDLGGISEEGRPLIFDDLANAPRYRGEPGQTGAIRLEVMTTNLGHQEPHRIPFINRRFWFLEEDFRSLFPDDVVNWMKSQSNENEAIDYGGKRYFLLPEPGKLPVVVAVRMSLSFPLLLSAVPLYVQELGLPREEVAGQAIGPDVINEDVDIIQVAGVPETERGGRRLLGMRVCWFSDGGISSNFPLHFFDGPLPQWPTFGINLFYPDPEHFDARPRVFMPQRNNEGWQPTYVALEGGGAVVEIARFIKTIITTMQNWRDTLQARAPGYRDRIVNIRIDPQEGGMNLDMHSEVTRPLTERGTLAGRTILQTFDLNNHVWVRYRNSLAGLEPYIIDFAKVIAEEAWPTYREAWNKIKTGSRPPPSYEWLAGQRSCAVMVRDKLVDLERDPKSLNRKGIFS